DNLKDVQTKMREYMDNQVKLCWLFNRKTRRVEIYRLGQEVEILQDPAQMSGEDILPGFVLDMQIVWG
ncbi:MAG TPA: Uma2 family endonuclease, partial [Candidatus Sericytochromatia bacterium]